MRHLALVTVAALLIALGLVLLVSEDETAEDQGETVAESTVDGPQSTETSPQPTAPSPQPSDPDVEAVERAVFVYVEAAERGEVDGRGLPTSDELSIRDVEVEGSDATVRLAGGATLTLRKSDGEWRVERVRSGATPQPTPPSNG